MQIAPTTLTLPNSKTLTLQAWPRQDNDPRQAWDGADRYALNWLDKHIGIHALGKADSAWILNDSFGALTLSAAIESMNVVSITDSAMTMEAIAHNAELNRVPVPAMIPPGQVPSSQPCCLIARVPRQLSLLEYQLQYLTDNLAANIPVLIVGMDKHLPEKLKALLQVYLNGVDTLPGRYKAHGFLGLTPGRLSGANFRTFPGEYYCEPVKAQLKAHAGVFSHQKTDPGGALLCQYIPKGICGEIVDLGCGAGMLGICAISKNSDASLTFVDESYQAIRSASDNVANLYPDRHAKDRFFVNNGLNGLGITADMVLLNPPFHQQNALGTQVGEKLIEDAAAALTSGGPLLLVQNRHLDYRKTLKALFSTVVQIGQDSRFRVLRATR